MDDDVILQAKSFRWEGDDLIVTTLDGRVIRMHKPYPVAHAMHFPDDSTVVQESLALAFDRYELIGYGRGGLN
jgi:hypothetical protein